MTEIFRCIAGSRLYGTNTPDSDLDYKAIHLPTKRQILMGKRDQARSTSSGGSEKNTAEDVDTESFELQRYLGLVAGMQTVPVELLFTMDHYGRKLPQVKGYKWPWLQIVKNRERLLSKNAKSFVGYCKAQSIRYGLRGERLNSFREVVNVLSIGLASGMKKVGELRNQLLPVKHVTGVNRQQPGGGEVMYIDLCGRQVAETVSIVEAIAIYQKPIDQAGNRAKAAADNNGADLKALYHAYRIADEGVQLFRDGYISFPSRKASVLKRIRNGDFSPDGVVEMFEERRAYMEECASFSDFPEKPDYEWINNFVMEVHENIVKGHTY